jgi:hypothetical protein
MRRSVVSAAIAVAGIAGIAGGAAMAATSGTIPTLSANGSSFTSGSYFFDANTAHPVAGFNYSGYLRDTKADGNGTKVHAKVDGYGYAPAQYNNDGAGSAQWVSQKITGADPAQAGMVQECTVISLAPDSCASSSWFYR